MFLAALVLMLCLGGSYYGVREVALRIADHLTVTITRSPFSTDGPVGSVVYQRTFGRTLAAEAEHLLNDETEPYTHPYGNLWGGHEWHYHLAFTWHGMLIETADVDTMDPPEDYAISALGLRDLQDRQPSAAAPSHVILGQIIQDSGGAIPVSNPYAPDS
jgi:hypothetical protein